MKEKLEDASIVAYANIQKKNIKKLIRRQKEGELICPKTCQVCEALKIKDFSGRINYYCELYEESIFTKDGYTELYSNFECNEKTYRRACKHCNHFGDCLISASLNGNNPYSNVCEFYEYGYDNWRRSLNNIVEI